jgi:hypothetical protein
MPENVGYYQKFNVTRKDGRDQPGGDRTNAEYFVLDLTHDPYAIHALRGYVEASKRDLPLLAADLHQKFGV